MFFFFNPRFAQEFQAKIQKERDYPLPKKSKIRGKDKDDSGDERKMLVIQVCGVLVCVF